MQTIKWVALTSALACFSALTCFSGTCFATQPSKAVGRKVSSLTLKDFRGQSHALDKILQTKKGVAVIFLGTECPLAKLYAHRMQELCKEFEGKGIAFLGIDSNRQDSLTALDAFARQYGITFPLLKDLGNKAADQFGATRTPEAFLLDASGTIRYRGRIDDQYGFGAGVGYAQPQLRRRDLAEAMKQVLAGKPVSLAATEAKGCLIGRMKEPAKDSAVTYSNQISRLLNERCVSCHRPGQIGPFSMTSYAEVAGWGDMIAEVVREQRMPPWHANPHYGKFANANVLSDGDKQEIYAWVAAGCPEGNRAELAAPPKFPVGWLLARSPDKIVAMNDKPVEVKAEGVEDYRYYVADPGFKEDKWVKSAECMPGNASVVHHIIVFAAPPQYVDKMVEGQKRQLAAIAKAKADKKKTDGKKVAEPAQPKNRERRGARQNAGRENRGEGEGDVSGMDLLCGFAPGTRPFVAPEGMGKLVPAGWKFIFQMHYTPNGSPQKDLSSIGLLFEDPKKITQRLVTSNTANFEFQIPAYADNYKVEANRKFVRDTLLISMYPHMHIRGKAFRYQLTYPNGKSEILLDVPRYDFNWQNWFKLETPLLLPAGSQLHCTAYFDNSTNNLFNPDPTKPVRWGDQTWEEMMIGWYDVAFPKDQAQKQIDEQHEADRKEIRQAIERLQKRAVEKKADKKQAAN